MEFLKVIKRKLIANRMFFQLQKDWANLDKLALRYRCFTAVIFLQTIFSKLQPCDHSNSSNQFTTNLKAIQSSNHPIQLNHILLSYSLLNPLLSLANLLASPKSPKKLKNKIWKASNLIKKGIKIILLEF